MSTPGIGPEHPPDPRRGRAAMLLALRFYLRELRAHRRWAAPALLLPPLANICLYFLPPVIVGSAVGRLAAGTSPSAEVLTPYVLAFAGALLAGEVLFRIAVHCLIRAEANGIEDLYVAGMAELTARDASFFHDHFAGSLTKRVLSFASRYEEFLDTLSFRVVADLVPLGFAAVVLWRYDPWLVAVLFGTVALTVAAVVPLIRRRQVIVDAREACWARVSGHVADTLSNMDTVRAHAAELREAHAHAARVGELKALTKRSWDYSNLRIESTVGPIAVVANSLGLLLALRVGGGRLGVEGIVVTFAYFAQATRILFEFNQTYRGIESALTEAAQFTALLEARPTVLDPAEPRVPARRSGAVALERVRFTHPGASEPLFRGLDLAVGDGERLGLVGRSGGGKTTVIRLFLRLADVEGGRILIGGEDIATWRQADLRAQIAYVPQDPQMFHRTLRENIAFGRPGAGEREIKAAAAAAHVLDFVDALPQGLDTMVGERGVKLSGGQRQRVAIARAILRDAPILLLDEATSALDSESEAHIQTALWELMAGRTAIVVAHRLSTVARMDRLVVLDRGRILEQGTHAELLAREGAYAALWLRQSGGFLAEADAGPLPLAIR